MDNGNENSKKCSYCGMDIPADARRCSYCGSLLEVKADQNVFKSPQDAEPPSWKGETPNTENGEGITGYKADSQAQPEVRQVFEANTAYNSGNSYRQDYKMPSYGRSSREPLSNGLKVFLTILFTVIPGIGQLAGIITAIVFMNADDDADRKSFGVALLVASIILFVLSCIGCFVLILVLSINQSSIFYGN